MPGCSEQTGRPRDPVNSPNAGQSRESIPIWRGWGRTTGSALQSWEHVRTEAQKQLMGAISRGKIALNGFVVGDHRQRKWDWSQGEFASSRVTLMAGKVLPALSPSRLRRVCPGFSPHAAPIDVPRVLTVPADQRAWKGNRR